MRWSEKDRKFSRLQTPAGEGGTEVRQADEVEDQDAKSLVAVNVNKSSSDPQGTHYQQQWSGFARVERPEYRAPISVQQQAEPHETSELQGDTEQQHPIPVDPVDASTTRRHRKTRAGRRRLRKRMSTAAIVEPSVDPEPQRQGNYSQSTEFRYRKAICVGCRLLRRECDTDAQCNACEKEGMKCVRMRCLKGEDCLSKKCLYWHPGQCGRGGELTVEDGRLPRPL